MTEAFGSLRVSNDELASVREASRELQHLLERLDARQVEKIVLTQKNQMRGVLLSVERYSALTGGDRSEPG